MALENERIYLVMNMPNTIIVTFHYDFNCERDLGTEEIPAVENRLLARGYIAIYRPI